MEQQKRFILAMFLSAGILIAWQTFFMPPPPTTGAPSATQDAFKKTADKTGDAKTGTPTPTPTPPVVKPAKVVPVQVSTITAGDFTISLTNAGGRMSSLKLKEPAQYQRAGDLLGHYPKKSTNLPFQISFDKGNVAIPSDVVFEVVKTPAEGASAEKGKNDSVVYRYVDPAGRFEVHKTFTLVHDDKKPHSLDLKVDVKNLSGAPINDRFLLDITGYKDPEGAGGSILDLLNFRPAELEAICHLADDTERVLVDGIKDDIKTFKEGGVVWAAIGTRYFIRAVVPQTQAEACVVQKVDKDFLRMRMSWKDFTVAPGQTHTYKQSVYLGPKDLDVLGDIHPQMSDSVDYGIFTVLAKPMRWLLNFFYELVKNWGLAIILLTLVIKALTWPFTEKSYANAERMKEIQPLLDEVRSKYENDQQRVAEETMKIFKENKFNPLGGCLPMLLQMPILYALFVMINNSVELYQASFILWYTDLSASDPYFVLPILMGITMVVQQRFMTPTGSAANPQTKIMLQIMPIMFTVLMLALPSGLVLYYFLNLLLGVFQQYMIRRKFARQREAKAAA